jgi:hypothetical protein
MKIWYLAGFAGFPLSVRLRRHWNGAGFGLAWTEGPIIQRLTAELRNGADFRMALNIMVPGFARVAGFSLSVHSITFV